MVDFDRLLGGESNANETDPLKIFERLDKQVTKEDLRTNQETILKNWHENHLDKKDVIVKLHTGEGKTLLGLLMLQSSLNAGLGPAIFLCPDTYLVKQATREAESFGIKTVLACEDRKLPLDFRNSKAILITTCQKLFNGKSVFAVSGSGKDIVPIGALVMDDAHACVDIIRKSFSITVSKNDSEEEKRLYNELWALFEAPLMRQAQGTCIDIKGGSDGVMAVPFWAWHDNRKNVLEILNEHKDVQSVKFAWDFLKNKIPSSACLFSGKKMQISLRLSPIDMLPSFTGAKRRIFLSATLNDDAFLVRDLGIDADSVSNPLTSASKYRGERLVIIPTLVSPSLTRYKMIKWVSKLAEKHGEFGTMSIVPSSKLAEDWTREGGDIADVKNLEEKLKKVKDAIRENRCTKVTVLVNKYDGVDLPDSLCRILCLDSMPVHMSLFESYVQKVREGSSAVRRLLSQRIEQGIGRAIRGGSDWCIVIITGDSLSDFVSETDKRKFLSDKTKKQIEIAEILAKEMKKEGRNMLDVVEKLIQQSLDREKSWKSYYDKKMKEVEPVCLSNEFLKIFQLERDAELKYQHDDFSGAVKTVNKIMDAVAENDKGWYLQLMATYLYPSDATGSMEKQKKAFKKNNLLHKPELGTVYNRLSSDTNGREAEILGWIRKHESHNLLMADLRRTLDSVAFGTPSESFEEGIKGLGELLGFPSQRPEKESDKGPDNLWSVGGKMYWLISCKNEVKYDRPHISKKEIGQLDNDIGWFNKYYEECDLKPILIHPANTLNRDAFPTQKPYVIREANLDNLKENVIKFYTCFNRYPLDDITEELIKTKLSEHKLDLYNLTRKYTEEIKHSK